MAPTLLAIVKADLKTAKSLVRSSDKFQKHQAAYPREKDWKLSYSGNTEGFYLQSDQNYGTVAEKYQIAFDSAPSWHGKVNHRLFDASAFPVINFIYEIT